MPRKVPQLQQPLNKEIRSISDIILEFLATYQFLDEENHGYLLTDR